MTALHLQGILVALGCSGPDCPHGSWPVDGAEVAWYDEHLKWHMNEVLGKREGVAEKHIAAGAVEDAAQT